MSIVTDAVVPGFNAPGVFRHECGWPMMTFEDGHRTSHEQAEVACSWGCCMVFYCPKCGRNMGGHGPIDCPCTKGGRGHGTAGEQPRRRVRKRKVKR